MPGRHILLVEDDAVLRDLLWRNLQARGYDVRLAGDAQTALNELRVGPVDLVVLDINLPDQTGWEVLRIAQQEGWLHLRVHDGEASRLPVVVISAVRASLARLKEFHLLAYLPKPFPIDSLLRLAEEACLEKKEES
jgi:DNA-binding response OmpR family regulator